ncbi:TolC family protein [Sorangium sp. So ce1128]
MKSTAPSSRRSLSLASMLAGLLALGLLAPAAAAQPAAPPPVAPQPAPAPPAPGQPQAPQAPAAAAPPPAKADPLATALAAQPGGLTPDEFAKIALQTHASLRAKQADLRAASARVDQAVVSFFPRITLTASYMRLSEVEQDPRLAQFGLGAQILNQYSLSAGLVVPISDYVLRISQGYAAASHSESAKKLEVQAEALKIAADAKISFFNWVGLKGLIVVRGEAVSQAKTHLVDAQRTFEVGLLSRADVLRLEAQVANAEQLLSEAEATLLVADEQIRIALGAAAQGRPLTVGIDVMSGSLAAQPPRESLSALQQEALAKRLEIRALDETLYSLKNTEQLTRAGYFPRLDAVADLTYANPNQRIFPTREEFDLTWAAGARATWVLNDIATAAGASAEASARTAQVAEQKALLRDGLRMEVAQAYTDVSKAARSIETAERQLAAAAESMRVKSELFRAGRATSTDLVDSEREVTTARLLQLNARVGTLVAKTRLDHAVGRDANNVK